MEDQILSQLNNLSSGVDKITGKFGLTHNPFPKSGIASVSDKSKAVGQLIPTKKETLDKILDYIKDALKKRDEDNYLSLIVRGDYGTGKTQTLMYIRYLLSNLNNEGFKPYVVYVDDPGLSLSELFGGIIAQVGVENFRRYLWNRFMSYLDDNNINILKEIPQAQVVPSLFSDTDDSRLTDRFLSYKELFDTCVAGRSNNEKKEITAILKGHIMYCFSTIFNSAAVAGYFYDVVCETVGISKSWDSLTSGSVKELDKREVYILKAIVNTVKDQENITDFVILVDEFEEITSGRLKKSEIDNYLRNLRTLIDRDKNWCSVFAMTGKALDRINEFSPPLASRITDRIIDLTPLDFTTCRELIIRYLSIARSESECIEDELYPFTNESIQKLLSVKPAYANLQGSPRFILKNCFLLLERAVEELEKGDFIDSEFVAKFIGEYLK
jgi:hypothetical protein